MDVHMQELVHAARQPHPGLTSGLLVNSTVFTLGLSVLLKGDLHTLSTAMKADHGFLCVMASYLFLQD